MIETQTYTTSTCLIGQLVINHPHFLDLSRPGRRRRSPPYSQRGFRGRNTKERVGLTLQQQLFHGLLPHFGSTEPAATYLLRPTRRQQKQQHAAVMVLQMKWIWKCPCTTLPGGGEHQILHLAEIAESDEHLFWGGDACLHGGTRMRLGRGRQAGHFSSS